MIPHQLFYNAAGSVLTWTQSGTGVAAYSVLATGVAYFDMQFLPAGGAAVARAKVFGVQTTWTIACDYTLDIHNGDIVVLLYKLDTIAQSLEALGEPEFYTVLGQDPSGSRVLASRRLIVGKYDQA